MANGFSQITKDLRSGLSLKLMNWAMDIAPEGPEQTSIALFLRGHIELVVSSDPRFSKLKDELFGRKP
ncbi:hypothetical protein J2855_001775 [Agrobacterium tumefaciens]|uniref:hypothetical protein n=1 Tax=Agrobacterium tumefaciens TaxID=358 RepID=UPI000DD475FB|nr:hypothetical protein [Agrobacterium tumefaciens]MBP2508140.1 hypothetical protein [Agrobacterium tumefaciens]MBP2517292.1 hypothetical protein [Agrobacterium tumefaciens]MBP2575926.1 hypothetical protein [Agrobacterium tumefaciens]MBP2594282.1 hypothetical protein [Agrobacterium tumefaciens]